MAKTPEIPSVSYIYYTTNSIFFCYQNVKFFINKGGIFIYIPSITSIENALKIYYENAEIGNKEIKVLFGERSTVTISRLKKLAKSEMIKNDVPTFCSNKVNTSVAFNVWGIDVNDLEERRKKIKELSL